MLNLNKDLDGGATNAVIRHNPVNHPYQDTRQSGVSAVVGHDPVNHPSHYTDGGIETIDFIEAKQLPYHLGNAVKYISRAGKKDDELQDLRKARWYLDRYIQLREHDLLDYIPNPERSERCEATLK